jgi:hypothetical protein
MDNSVTYEEAIKRCNDYRDGLGRSMSVWDLSTALAVIFEKTKEDTLRDLSTAWSKT